jgi:hypothetical protein
MRKRALDPRRLAQASALSLGLLALAAGSSPVRTTGGGAPTQEDSAGCVHCHEGIEDMHPAAPLSCVECHGGDGSTRNKILAHVAPPASVDTDESVPPLDRDLAWRRFRNPMDLRVVELTCAGCHQAQVDSLHTSLHGTTGIALSCRRQRDRRGAPGAGYFRLSSRDPQGRGRLARNAGRNGATSLTVVKPTKRRSEK